MIEDDDGLGKKSGQETATARDRSSRAGPRVRRTDGTPAPRLKDIAKIAGVSLQTVSYVMNNNGSVSEEVRARVRQIGKRMGYRPNRSAKAMRTGRSQTLGLVISDMSNPFYAEFARAVERAAAAEGYAVLLVDAQAPAAETAEIAERIAGLKSHPVDGVISAVRYPSVLTLDVPVVLLGVPVRGRDSVSSDDVRGGKALAEHLLSLGHRRFGLVTSPLPGGIPIRRDALMERLRGEAEIVWEYETPASEMVAPDIAGFLLRRDVSIIVCSNDIVAISVQRALRDLGIVVPDDVSVVGYDDIPWAAIVTPALTTMRLPLADMGSAAVRFVVDRLHGPRRRARRVNLPVTLVVRESVAKPSARFVGPEGQIGDAGVSNKSISGSRADGPARASVPSRSNGNET